MQYVLFLVFLETAVTPLKQYFSFEACNDARITLEQEQAKHETDNAFVASVTLATVTYVCLPVPPSYKLDR